MKTIALLGLGKMGQGIAKSILRSGYKLVVWTRSHDKAKEAIASGAVWAENPAQAVKEADYVLSMLSDDAASEAVWLGENGAMNYLNSGTFIIECSTLSHDYVTRLSAIAKSKGVSYIDCPVTGLPEVAAEGKLTLLVGASQEDLDSCKPVLELFSKTIRHFGSVGKGTCYKLIINLMGAVQIAALAEGLALAEKLALDKETVTAAIENSAAASPQVLRHIRKMVEKKFEKDPSFTVALRQKDAAYALKLADEVNFIAKLGIISEEWFSAAKKTYANKDEACVINVMN